MRTTKNTFEVKQGLEIPIGKANTPSLILYREGYTTSYNAATRTPNWVAWHLTSDHTNGPIKRKGITFQADEEIPAPRVDTYDYMRSGYDRGHMCPAGDNHWSQKSNGTEFPDDEYLSTSTSLEQWFVEYSRKALSNMGRAIWRRLYCLWTYLFQSKA